MSDLANALFCDNVGRTYSDLRCCYINNQTSSTCHDAFNATGPTFHGGCDDRDCVSQCQNTTSLFMSASQDDVITGNGLAPIQRFRTCVNVPTMAGFASHGVLSDEIAVLVNRHIASDVPPAGLENVTNAVTECLTQTCKASRRRRLCSRDCSAVNMLRNSTTPDIRGVNQCLNVLCTGGYHSLPYADADVVGIGVFVSYIMQCAIVIILWFLLFTFGRFGNKQPTPSKQPTQTTRTVSLKPSTEESTHLSLLEKLLVQFHVAQCYFSATIQVASLSYGIFSADLLMTFMILPLATNGVLPVIFGFFLLLQHGLDSFAITLVTSICWLLSTIVYWVLYASIIPIHERFESEERRYKAYQQFTYKLSSLDACGGYSALAVCPGNFHVGKDEVTSASRRLRYLTPIIWSFSTICILAIISIKLLVWRQCRKARSKRQNGVDTELVHTTKINPDPARESIKSTVVVPETRTEEDIHGRVSHRQGQRTATSPTPRSASNVAPSTGLNLSNRSKTIIWSLTTACFLAGMGMQLSLLSIGTSLKMMNRKDWGFGQIVAVMIWVPPLLEYGYNELEMILGW